ncbi:UDP-glycosyltransferase 85A5 [Raphanus sativus]|uniref:Glycosyltransferase n=1 Tax=Raphanus sativus TaxID=3726 RepID=A0A6J0NHZ8_RAPSA|nr:UDP-glycosyltransferase 85A5 [Raphanus sativus]KAJ4916403.1 UDP-glycosyltransferase 85A5 [Raphanus sativus]
MASYTVSSGQKPHVVCVPFPAQGHIDPMLKLAKLLHNKGFHVTFVNNVYNHNRLLRSRGPNALDRIPTFRYESIPDGLLETDGDRMQDVPSICEATMKNFLAPFKELLERINTRDDVPPVSCIVSDGIMSFTLDAAEELGVTCVNLWTASACGFLAYMYFHSFIEKGLCPLKDESYLNTQIDWIPSMKNLKLKDIPSFIRATSRDDIMLNFSLHETDQLKRASAIILNTFDDLEHDIIQSLQSILPPLYPIGPLSLLVNRDIDKDSEIGRMGSSLWKEETKCLDWLDTKPQNSVVYVNFGSITVMSAKQLVEFAWGLAATGKEFLWVIRPDLVDGDVPMLPPEFLTETAGRRMLATWCPQEKVLAHPAVGGFLTHCGWNSTIESLCGGVPMVCWPFFAEQPTNCKFCCEEWGVGMEIGGDVGRKEVEAVVRELMDGEKGKKMREKAEEWRGLAEKATEHTCGSSELNLQIVVDMVLLGQQRAMGML